MAAGVSHSDDSMFCAPPNLSTASLHMVITGANLPPELFPSILRHVGLARHGRQAGVANASTYQDLQSCSLVCLDWANRCRRYLFAGKTVAVKTAEELKLLDFYTVNGCEALVKLHTLLAGVILMPTLGCESWCHEIMRSPFYLGVKRSIYYNRQRSSLHMRSAAAAALDRVAYRSIHWSLPRSWPASLMALTNVTLHEIHFHSLSSLHTLLGNFTCSKNFSFQSITWDITDLVLSRFGDLGDGLHRIVPAAHHDLELFHRPSRKQHVVSTHNCTDDAYLSLVAHRRLVASSQSVLSQMTDIEQAACMTLLQAMLDSAGDSVRRNVPCRVQRGLQLTSGRLVEGIPLLDIQVDWEHSILFDTELGVTYVSLELHCETVLGANGVPLSARVVDLRLGFVDYDGKDSTPFDENMHFQFFLKVVKLYNSTLPTFPHFRVAELHAPFPLYQHAVRASPDITQLPAPGDQILHCWACYTYTMDSEDLTAEARGHEFIEIDPRTLQIASPTRCWGRD